MGVRYRDKRGREQVGSADREVILAAGAYGSPQLLMLSGVGPADHLTSVGLSVQADVPGVGQNLQDHPYVTCVWHVDGGGSLLDAEHPKYLAEWLLRGTGPLTSTVAEAFAFVRSRPGLPAPDLQFHFAPAYFVDHGFEKYDHDALTSAPVLITPKSRGRLTLRSADPRAKPRILTNSLSEPEDLAALIEGVRISREIMRQGPLSEVAGKELLPGNDMNDDDLEGDIRRRVDLLYHPVGTCRMGADADELAVLDPQLRVRGVEGLRVADASVMPVIPGGNTNAPTIMVAERAADLIGQSVTV